MNLRSYAAIIVCFVLLLVVRSGNGLVLAQQNANTPPQQMMTPVSPPSVPATDGQANARKALVDRLHLRTYEAAAGNLLACQEDKFCLKEAKRIKGWVCVNAACNQTDKSKRPIDCFEGAFNKNSKEEQDQIASSMCALIGSPSAVTRQALLSHLSDPQATEDYLVEQGAFLLALKGSAESCENYIKDYVGAYGPQWKSQWYRALSGCRILTGERTREQEEKDFYTWFGVVQGTGACADIVNSQMRSACSTPGAATPVPSSPQPLDNAK